MLGAAFRRHRHIWRFTITVVLIAVLVVITRNVDDDPAMSPEAIIQAMLHAVAQDPQVRETETRDFVERAAAFTANKKQSSAESYFALGLRLWGANQLVESAKALRKSIALKPDWSWPHNALGIVLYGMGRTKEANKEFRKAIELEPTWSRPYNDLAVVLRRQGKYEEAEQQALKAIELAPGDLAAYNNYGNLLVAMGRFEEARTAYEKAAALEPTHPAPNYNLACLACMLGRPQDALMPLEHAVANSEAYRRSALTDPDLAPLREDPLFQELMRRYPPAAL